MQKCIVKVGPTGELSTDEYYNIVGVK